MIASIFKNFLSLFLLIFLYIFALKVVLTDIKINSDFIYVFTVILLPFFDKLYEYLKNEINFKKYKYSKGLFFIFFLIILLWIVLFLSWEDIIIILIIVYLFLSIILQFDPRITISIALICFIYSTIYLFLWIYNYSSDLLIYCYYFLIIAFLNYFTHKIW